MNERKERDEDDTPALAENYKQKMQKEADEFSEKSAGSFSGALGKFQQVSGLTFDILKLLGIITIAIPIVRQAISGFGLMWNSVLSGLGVFKKEGVWARGIKTTVGVATLGLLIASLAAPAAALTIGFVALGLGVAQDIWTFSAALISRSRGSWKKERDEYDEKEKEYFTLLSLEPEGLKIIERGRKINNLENRIDSLEEKIKKLRENNGIEYELKARELVKERNELQKVFDLEQEDYVSKLSKNQKKLLELDKKIHKGSNYLRGRDGQLASKVHGLVLGAVAVAGVVLLVTPLAPIGAALLLATTIYGVLNTFDFPGKWASRISNYFFGPKKPDSIEKTEAKLEKFQKDNPELIKQARQKKLEKSSLEPIIRPHVNESEVAIAHKLGREVVASRVSKEVDSSLSVSPAAVNDNDKVVAANEDTFAKDETETEAESESPKKKLK